MSHHSRCMPTYDPPRPTPPPIWTWDEPRPTPMPMPTWDPPRPTPMPFPNEPRPTWDPPRPTPMPIPNKPMPTHDTWQWPMQVLSIDLLLEENGTNHRTDDYQNNFVIRRGGTFNVRVVHPRLDAEDSSSEKTTNYFELRTGENPSKRNGTLIQINEKVRSEDESNEYWFQVTSRTDEYYNATIFIPAHALVSSYQLVLVSVNRQLIGRRGDLRAEYPAEKTLYIIFNPWNENDEVYMEDEDLKKEYVLNDSGYVCTGGQYPKPWNFAQFTDAALKCTFKLLESARRVTMRDSAREVARYMTSMTNNCANRYGLLHGKWDGDYSGGVKPGEWAGSHAIFKKYLETGQPVKYGQCWVFSGLTTSMMRCLGIPVRSVSNYDSAHDRDGNCTNDKYFDEEGNELPDEEGTPDSVWNFHVWNDVWMARPDLKPGMGGWQAIDGTPQEESQGAFQCGPAPLQAIKEGDIHAPFDTRFLFSEVNADTVYWIRDRNGNEKALDVYPNSIGTALLTKVPNRRAVEDIMDQYKYPEGSKLERAVVRTVMKKVENPVVLNQPKDVKFNVRVPFNVTVGEEGYATIPLKVYANNKKSQPLTVNVTVIPHVLRYNGVKLMTLEKMTSEVRVSGREDRAMKFRFDTGSIPYRFMDESCSIRFSVFAKVLETGQIWISQEMSNIQKPQLKVELIMGDDGIVLSQKSMTVRIYLPKQAGIKKYTNAYLFVESPLVEDVGLQLTDAEANAQCGYVDKTFEVGVFRRTRECDFNLTFNSSEISGVEGSMTVTVEPLIETVFS